MEYDEMRIRLLYHKIMRYIKHKLWYIWHCRLRSFFDRKFYSTNYYGEDHAWWMPCCNGNPGGWRTNLCDSLEDYSTGWRYHDAIINEIEEC